MKHDINEITQHHDYKIWAEFISDKIKLAQTKTAFKVNAEMLPCIGKLGIPLLKNKIKAVGVVR